MENHKLRDTIEKSLISQLSKDIIECPPETFEDFESYNHKFQMWMERLETHPDHFEEIKSDIQPS